MAPAPSFKIHSFSSLIVLSLSSVNARSESNSIKKKKQMKTLEITEFQLWLMAFRVKCCSGGDTNISKLHLRPKRKVCCSTQKLENNSATQSGQKLQPSGSVHTNSLMGGCIQTNFLCSYYSQITEVSAVEAQQWGSHTSVVEEGWDTAKQRFP